MIFISHPDGRSLVDEVSLAEQQLQMRRARLRTGLHALDMAVRRRVTAPDALLWGVGTGFVLGELTKNRAATSATSAQPRESSTSLDESSPPRRGAIQLILHYWAIARPIIATTTNMLMPYLSAKAVAMGESAATREVDEMSGAHSSPQTR